MKPKPETEASEVAERAVRAWERLATRLAPIIGERGFRVLYERSVHLTQSAFPWLAPPDEPQQDSFLAILRQSLERQHPTLAADAHRALLLTFTGLLNSLIGEVLTTRLMQAEPLDRGAAERAQESSNDR